MPLVDSFEAAQNSVKAETENEQKINAAYQVLHYTNFTNDSMTADSFSRRLAREGGAFKEQSWLDEKDSAF